jgi:hypothetical protein
MMNRIIRIITLTITLLTLLLVSRKAFSQQIPHQMIVPYAISDITGLQAALDLKANLASPNLTGVPTAPTAAANTNNTQIATTAYVDTGLALKEDTSNKDNGALSTSSTTFPTSGAVKTYVDAINTTLTTSISGKQSGPLTGDVTTPSASNAAATIAANAVTYAKFQQGPARSVLGVAGSLTANYAAISCSADNNVIRRASGTLACGTIDTAAIGSGTLSIARGGTNSTTALVNGRIMRSNSSAINESAILESNLTGLTSNVQTQLNTLTTEVSYKDISGWRRKAGTGSPAIDNVYSARATAGDYTTGNYGGPTIYYIPIVFTTVFDVKDILLENVSTGSFIQLGLYTSNGDKYPRTRIFTSGDIDVSGSTGENSYSPGLDANLPGLYFLAVGVKGPTDLESISRTQLHNHLGIDGATGSMITAYLETGAYVLPSTATVSSTTHAGDVPEILLRLE